MDKSIPFSSLRSPFPCDVLPPLQDTFEPKQSIQQKCLNRKTNKHRSLGGARNWTNCATKFFGPDQPNALLFGLPETVAVEKQPSLKRD